MYAKALYVFCAQALLIQLALGQVLYSSPSLGNTMVENAFVTGTEAAFANNLVGLSGSGLANLVNNAAVAANVNPAFLSLASYSGGGVLPVTSYSPLIPSGMTVLSDNNIEGQVVVNGQLPFLSAVAFEGSMSSDGFGSTSCGCGDGLIGIINENFIPAASAARGALGPNGLGRAGLGGRLY